MTLPPETNIPLNTTNSVNPSAPVTNDESSGASPSGFANRDVFDHLMNSADKTAPFFVPTNSSLNRPLMDDLASSFTKTDVEALKNGASPLREFTPHQSALIDNILNNSGPGARYQLDPVVTKQLQLRMDGLQKEQLGLGQMTGIYSAAQNSDEMAATTLAGQSLSKPFSTFFGFITNGEKQLYGIEQELSSLGGPEGKTLSPADMLRLQLKMSHVSQQLELFTGMLNKGLESSKTVLNTQI